MRAESFKRRLQRRRFLLLALLIVAVSLLATLAPAKSFASNGDAATPEYITWDDLSGKKVGLLAGAPFEIKVREKCPKVGEISYYSTMSDMLAALRGNKIDALVNNRALALLTINRYDDVALFPEALGEFKMGICWATTSRRCSSAPRSWTIS